MLNSTTYWCQTCICTEAKIWKHAAQYVCCCLARRSGGGVLFELNTDVFIHSTKEKQKKLFIIMLVLVVVVTYDHIQYTAFRPFSLRFMVTKTYHASPMLRHLGEVLLFKFCLFK